MLTLDVSRSKLMAFGLSFFSMLAHAAVCQDLNVGFRGVPGMERGSAFLLTDATPSQKAIVAALMFSGRSVAELRMYLNNESSSSSIRILSAWQLAISSAKSRLINGEKSTKFSQDESDLFIDAITQCGIEIPEYWQSLLRNGDYMSNDWFDPFTISTNEPKSNFPASIRDGSGNLLIKTIHGDFVLPILNKVSEPQLLAVKEFDGDVVVILDDPEEAWGYYCARISSSKLLWLVRVEPYWIFPEGGSYAVDLTISNNSDAIVFCALPCSISINGFDLKTGKRTVSFSSKLGAIDEHVILENSQLDE